MAKDPAFLLYSKDWLQGTAGLFPAEKGVFIDLIAHHHQDGYLPTDERRLAKMGGVSLEEFKEIWAHLKNKFYEEDGKYYNKKLLSVENDRAEYSEMRTIIGTFGQLIKNTECPEEKRIQIRKKFNYRDFLGQEKQNVSNLLTIWITNNLKLTQPKHGDADADADYNIKEGVEDILLNEKLLVPAMFSKFKEKMKSYPFVKDKDFKPLHDIAKFIHSQLNLNGDVLRNQTEVLAEWQKICLVISKDSFYRQKTLNTISNHIQEIFQIHKDGKTTGTNQHSASDIGKSLKFDKA